MAGLPRGAVPTPLVVTMAAKNGGSGSDKPFTYCPGGVDFSELKSPKMSRRIARNQEQGAAAANQRQVTEKMQSFKQYFYKSILTHTSMYDTTIKSMMIALTQPAFSTSNENLLYLKTLSLN